VSAAVLNGRIAGDRSLEFHFALLERERGTSRQLCFLTQSAESLEKKRVEFFLSAKKCNRVRKIVKRNEMREKCRGYGAGEVRREFQIGKSWYTPGSFRKSGKQGTCGIRNLEECGRA
jgi:hypothetical protein